VLRKDLEKLWAKVQKPARYSGGELNQILKDPAAVAVRVAFCFPDVYEVGMSNLGMRILYQCLNDVPSVWCERCFTPWVDMEAQLREHHLPLTTLESTTPLSDFDFVAITLPYEMCYTNLLTMLDLGGVPLVAAERTDDDPLVLAGGSCAYNPEPLAEIVDIFSIGEGEEALPELVRAYEAWRAQGGSRRAFLKEAAKLKGFYVPSLYHAEYHEDGTLKATVADEAFAPMPVARRIVEDFEHTVWPMAPIVPYMDVIHDRVTLEVFRGCTRGCRFCQAGMIYRPVRERSPETLVRQAAANIAASGYDELSLSSLSTGDYSDLGGLIRAIDADGTCRSATISLPSLRIDAFAPDYMKGVANERKAGLTLAPEAGTQRLRDVINKGVTEEDLMQSVRSAFQAGWDRVKFFFMLGLPTETEEDLAGIADLARKVIGVYRELPKEQRRRKLTITVSTSTFVPKADTPFQWCGQNDLETVRTKQRYLKELLRGIPGVSYHYHESTLSRLEAVFARGDRRVGKALLRAWELGCRFDGWSDCFRYEAWLRAFEETGIDIDFYAVRERGLEEALPWDHISCGVDKTFLKREYCKAMNTETTPDCRGNCQGCGLHKLGLKGDKGVSPCV